ncbi:penicillin-binding protein 1C [bacterium]|nr:penicillin-binding protein 1C [bacterium]
MSKTKIFIILFLISSITFAIFALWLSELPEQLFPDDYSTVILDRKGNIIRAFLNSSEQWCFRPEPETVIPEKLIKSAVLFEDRRFWTHPGVDIYSIIRAIGQNLGSMKKVSGASTITMQVIRLSTRNKRTYFNKFKEMLQSLRLERNLSKKQILHLYFNHAPYGGNIIGYEAASWRYFGKTAQQLTWSESASLAIIPNTPALWNSKQGRKKLINKRNRLLKRLLNSGEISKSTYLLSLQEKLPEGQISFPFKAPHFSRMVRSKHKGKTIKTTLDSSIQEKVEISVKNFIHRISDIGIHNAAVIVSENPSGKIRAYVGSQNYFDEKNQGKVDGVIAPRSTGSILKPFLYALAIDKGHIIPQSLIKDIPTYFGAYSPTNYDMKYSGIISAKDALIRSLNVPAVRLLAMTGVDTFYNMLKNSGITTLFRGYDEYGLTLVLGGSEVKLLELGGLYNGLANSGKFKSLVYLQTENKTKEIKLLSSGSCGMILDSLKEVKRPGTEFYWHKFQDHFPLAWKTGTSFGHRDAWAAGVNPQWTICVWIGNFDGRGNRELTGSKTAGPLLFTIFGQLPKDPLKFWFEKPDMDYKTEKVCKQSGYKFTNNCTDSIDVKIPFETFLRQCPYHKSLSFNKNMTHEVCSRCWSPDDRIVQKKLLFPPEVVQYLKESGQPYFTALPHKTSCTARPTGNSIDFIYPINGSRIVLPRELDGQYQKIVVRLASRTENNRVFWYLDDKFLLETSKDHTFSHAFSQGKHSLLAIDAAGNQKKIKFHIERR